MAEAPWSPQSPLPTVGPGSAQSLGEQSREPDPHRLPHAKLMAATPPTSSCHRDGVHSSDSHPSIVAPHWEGLGTFQNNTDVDLCSKTPRPGHGSRSHIRGTGVSHHCFLGPRGDTHPRRYTFSHVTGLREQGQRP